MAWPFSGCMCIRDLLVRWRECDPAIIVEDVALIGPSGPRTVRRVRRPTNSHQLSVTLPAHAGDADVLDPRVIANLCRRLGFDPAVALNDDLT